MLKSVIKIILKTKSTVQKGFFYVREIHFQLCLILNLKKMSLLAVFIFISNLRMLHL